MALKFLNKNKSFIWPLLNVQSKYSGICTKYDWFTSTIYRDPGPATCRHYDFCVHIFQLITVVSSTRLMPQYERDCRRKF